MPGITRSLCSKGAASSEKRKKKDERRKKNGMKIERKGRKKKVMPM